MRTVIWQDYSSIPELLPGTPGERSESLDINNSGHIVGNEGFTFIPILWEWQVDHYVRIELEGFGSAKYINDTDPLQIVGNARIGSEIQACIWDKNGTRTLLGFLPGHNYSDVAAINNSAQVVGYSISGATRAAFLWEDHSQKVSRRLLSLLCSLRDKPQQVPCLYP